MIEIRITCTRENADIVVDKIADILDIRNKSQFYPNRGDKNVGRIYIKGDIKTVDKNG